MKDGTDKAVIEENYYVFYFNLSIFHSKHLNIRMIKFIIVFRKEL